jgi:Domain of unknown function (DUF5753)
MVISLIAQSSSPPPSGTAGRGICTAGAHPGMEGPFCLLSFPEPDDLDLVYLEQATSGLVPEEPEEVRRYTLMFGTLLGKALPAEESVAFMEKITENEI